jgi:hypothetical protein
MDKYEELANKIIDEVSEMVEKQHPELNLNTETAKKEGIENPAVIVGEDYYNLEESIANEIRNFVKKGVKENGNKRAKTRY